MERMTLDQLRVLEALADTGSVTGAAKRLFRAQSAVSYAIRVLEETLDLPLVNREGYRARLTPAGEAILLKSRELLAGAGELDALALELRGGAEPRLQLLVDGVLPVARLMPTLSRIAAEGLPTRIDLRIELLGGMERALEREEPDVVLAPAGRILRPERFEWDVIGSVVMLPVVSPRHPLARHPPPLPLKEMRRHVHLVVTSPPDRQIPVEGGMIGARMRWNFPDFTTRLEGLRAGLGFAWMPTYMVEEDLRDGRLVALIPESGGLHGFQAALIYRRTPPLGPTGRFVLGLLRELTDFPPPPPPDLLSRYDLT